LDPDLIESDLARSDRIDEAIDGTIKRLMQVKDGEADLSEYKKCES
jgi:hypothetical protein